MSRNRQIRTATPTLYVIAVLIAVFAGGGTALLVVAVIGALLVGLVFRLTAETDTPRARERAARRAERRR